jgi:hypothetical protein
LPGIIVNEGAKLKLRKTEIKGNKNHDTIGRLLFKINNWLLFVLLKIK